LEQLQGLAAAGTTLVLVSHHVEEIVPAIETVILLKGGRVHRRGNRQAMLTGEVLSELFEVPIRVADGPFGRQAADVAGDLAGDLAGDP